MIALSVALVLTATLAWHAFQSWLKSKHEANVVRAELLPKYAALELRLVDAERKLDGMAMQMGFARRGG